MDDTLKRTELTVDEDTGSSSVTILAVLLHDKASRLRVGVQEVSDSWYSVGRLIVKLVLLGNTNGDVS